MAGHFTDLPLLMDSVLENLGRNSFDINDSFGANGTADKYMCGALCQMAFPNASTNFLASVASAVTCSSWA